MALNDDDDDYDEVVDLSDGYNKDMIPDNDDDANVAEDDLVSLSVCQVVPTDLEGEVVLSIESGGDRIALWQAVPAPPPGKRVAPPSMTFEVPEELGKALLVEGIEGSGGLRDVTLVARFQKAGVVLEDTVKLSVIQVNLVVEGLPEEQEEDPGAFIQVNEDDDDLDGIMDSLDTDGVCGPEGNDDDLRKVTLEKPLAKEPATDKVVLTWTENPIHLYLNPDKTEQIFPTAPWNEFTVNSIPPLGKDFYMESASPGDHLYVKGNLVTAGVAVQDKPTLKDVTLKILMNDQDITAPGHDKVETIVGAHISLAATLAPESVYQEVTARRWTVDGFDADPGVSRVVRSYMVSFQGGEWATSEAEVTGLEEQNLTSEYIGFYWVDGSYVGDQRVVRHSVTLGGQAKTIEAHADFRVKRPDPTLELTSCAPVTLSQGDNPEYLPYGIRLGEIVPGGGDVTNGLVLNGYANVPGGFGGEIAFVQLYERHRQINGQWRHESGVDCRKDEQTGLPSDWRYERGDFHFTPEPPLPDGGETYVLQMKDNPAYSVQPHTPETTIVVRDGVAESHIRTWLMYTPGGALSIYVPLKKVAWHWQGDVHGSQLSGEESGFDGGAVDTRTIQSFPVWVTVLPWY